MKYLNRVNRTSRYQLFVLLVFWFSVFWSFSSSLALDRTYQDSWILEGVWLPLSILLLSYLVYISLSDNLSRITLLTSVIAFLLAALPALKYHFVYGSAVDQATHYDLIRTVALTGQVDPGSAYASTPGFQALVAMLARFSACSLSPWSKLLPAFLGALVPLAFYMLCRRVPMSAALSKLVIVLSAFSLPLLYRLNGTTFTIPLVVFLVIFLFLRLLENAGSGQRLSYSILFIIFALTVVFWHPASSLVFSATLLLSGIFLALLPAGKNAFLPRFSTAAALGLLCLVITLAYWMYSADFIWLHFVKNIRLAFQTELTPDLIPVRVYQIPILDRFLVFSFYHARDALLLGFSALGILQMIISRPRGSSGRLLPTYTVLWLSFLVVLAAVFISGYGAQGYRRFIFYLVALSPPLAAYGIWRSLVFLDKYGPRLSPSLAEAALLMLIILTACLQLYPYLPRMPAYQASASIDDPTPVLWLHQVNTLYQEYMLDFAFNQLVTDTQLITDYVANQQALLFFDRSTQGLSQRTVNQDTGPAYLLLHWPGTAGAFGEQAEFRSFAAIKSWVEKPNMSKVYDNGGSFILYYPDNVYSPFYLESNN